MISWSGCIRDPYLCDGSNEMEKADYPTDCKDSSDQSIENCCSYYHDIYKDLKKM